MQTLPRLEPERDYRRDHDGGDAYLAPSVERSLCLFCGAWYRWEEAHGQIIGGCYPPSDGWQEV
jgi:hypothetical protein